MNVYDFDNTIYDGDSTVDFYLFCLRRYPGICCFVLHQLWGFVMYKSGQIDKKQLKERFFSFLKKVPNQEKAVEAFWDRNEYKIKKWYLDQKCKDDVIVSASPFFLVEPCCRRNGINTVIASDVDIHTGIFNGPNCHDDMKPVLFRSVLPQGNLDEFYSDSLSDAPMARMAKRAFLIEKGRIVAWPNLK